uniref:Uncharacterized protein n=1 Tax=Timema bartmani TaxID=61472 RepID=A0A7R9HX02_9NEOP|nr:unnamed protein product [Timema bartmani]
MRCCLLVDCEPRTLQSMHIVSMYISKSQVAWFVARVVGRQAGRQAKLPSAVVMTCTDSKIPVNTQPQQHNENLENCQVVQNNSLHWHTPVSVHQALFSHLNEANAQFTEHQVIWQGNLSEEQQQQLQHESVSVTSDNQETTYTDLNKPSQSCHSISLPQEKKKKKTVLSKKTEINHKKKQQTYNKTLGSNLNQLEDNADQVRDRFDKGCECQENCFKRLSPEYVYRHRLNIAELTKAEHDMYLMGVTMAVLTNPEETVRHKERRRLRAHYVFQGKRVCLDAFLYLENTTHYQLKRIRKHVITHGVTPRVHGNHGKRAHNTFSLDIYRHATTFLRHYIDKHMTNSQTPAFSHEINQPSKHNKMGKTTPVYIAPDITRKTIHDAYREYCEHFEPAIKIMGYSTFRHFLKEQFPYVRFCKLDNKGPLINGAPGVVNTEGQSDSNSKSQRGNESHIDEKAEHQTTIITSDEGVQQITTIPVILSSSAVLPQQQQTFIVTPILQGSNNMPVGGTYTSYQLTTTAPAQTSVGTIVASVPSTGTYEFTTL